MAKWLPSAQVIRYLCVGAWNTLFGYSLFALLTYLLTDRVPYAYMVASALSHVLNVSVAFLGYRYFVFQVEGSLLRQYLRCHVVYGATFLVNFCLLPLYVTVLQWFLGEQTYLPYAAGAVLTLQGVVLSFFGHRHFSFAAARPTATTPVETGNGISASDDSLLQVDS
jgi:putative flippase GtrA